MVLKMMELQLVAIEKSGAEPDLRSEARRVRRVLTGLVIRPRARVRVKR